MSQQSDYLFFQADTADTDTFGDYFPQLQSDLSSDPATSPESSFSPVFSATTGTYSLPPPPPAAGPGGVDEWMLWETSKDSFSPQDMFDADPAFAASPTIDPLDLSGGAAPSATTRTSRNADIMSCQLFAPSSPMASPPLLPSPLDDLPRGSLCEGSSATASALNIRGGGGRASPRKRKSESSDGIDNAEEAATATFRRRRQQQESSTSPSPRQTTSSSNRRGQQPGRRSKNKADHGEVEQRYRNKLNAQITALRDVVQRSRDANAAGNSYDSDDNTEEKRNSDQGAALTKGAILTQAAAYIGELERRNRALESENRILRARVQRRFVAAMQQGEGVAGSGWCC